MADRRRDPAELGTDKIIKDIEKRIAKAKEEMK